MTARTAVSTTADERLQPPAAHPLLESSRSRRWTALLDRIGQGDLGACGTFYDESSQLTFSLVMQVVQDRDVAENMLVDLYVDVRDRAQRGEHRSRNSLTWLIGMARDAALSRRLQRRPVPAVGRIVPFGQNVRTFGTF